MPVPWIHHENLPKNRCPPYDDLVTHQRGSAQHAPRLLGLLLRESLCLSATRWAQKPVVSRGKSIPLTGFISIYTGMSMVLKICKSMHYALNKISYLDVYQLDD